MTKEQKKKEIKQRRTQAKKKQSAKGLRWSEAKEAMQSLPDDWRI